MSYIRKDGITIHETADFEGMRIAGRIAAETLDYITPFVQVGVSTGELDKLCQEYAEKKGAICACINYNGYKHATCISINHVVCHGIPSFERKLADGDIVNIDITVLFNGWHGDTSRMYYAGTPKLKATRLCEVTYECLMRSIDLVRPGVRLGDIGALIESICSKYGYGIVDDFCGHGLGRVLHDDELQVMHSGHKGTGPLLEEGMFFTIEPMINVGKKDLIILSDGWTAVTRDKSLSAQFEHSMGVTSDGCEIFTLSPKGYTKPPYKLG